MHYRILIPKRTDCETLKLLDLEIPLHKHCTKLRLKQMHYRRLISKQTDCETLKPLGLEIPLHKYCAKLRLRLKQKG